jgi:hypothetical protein
VQGDRVGRVEQIGVGVEELDLARLALDLGLDDVAGEQAVDDTDVSSISASFIAPRPIARRAEKPVPTPKSIRPGARPLSVAKALAVTAARRFDGTRTPVPSRIFEVFTAAAPIATKQSAVIIWVS